MKCFLSLTAHYVTRNFEYKSVLLDCRSYTQRHTGGNIAQVIDEIIEEYAVLTSEHLRRFCTTDGAANMRSAITKSKYIDGQLICVAHLLNNTIREAVDKSIVLSTCIEECRHLVSRLHTSKLDLTHIEEACEHLKGNKCFVFVMLVLLVCCTFLCLTLSCALTLQERNIYSTLNTFHHIFMFTKKEFIAKS